jgi:hypothetical protein
MGKSRKDEAYERGVRDGLDGDLIQDAIMGLGLGDIIPGGGEEWEVYGKGYDWGAGHRHDRERSSDQSSSGSFFSWGAEKKEDKKETKETSYPSDSYDYGGSYSDRSYKVPYTEADEKLDKVFGIGCAVIFFGLIASLALAIGTGIYGHTRKEKEKELLQASHRIERCEPKESLLEESLTLTEDFDDFSYFPGMSEIVYSKKVEYERRNSFISEPIMRSRIFKRDLNTGFEEIIGVREVNIQHWSRQRNLKAELSWEDLVAPIVSPDGKKIVFGVTRNDHGTGIYLMDNNGDNLEEVVMQGCGSVAYGWADDDILFYWRGPLSSPDMSDYQYFRSGKISLRNTSISESVEIDGLPKIAFPIKLVSHSRVQEFIVEDAEIEEEGRKMWENVWGEIQRDKKYRESLMDPETLIKRRLAKWIDKNKNSLGERFPKWFPSLDSIVRNMNDYQTMDEHIWVAFEMSLIGRPTFGYVFYSSDKKDWKIVWEDGYYSRDSFKFEFLNRNEGYITTPESVFYTNNNGSNWREIFKGGGGEEVLLKNSQ